MRVLDPCSGGRMMWFDRANPDVVFGDLRRETLTVTDRSHGNLDGTRTIRIEPDVQFDFRVIPYGAGGLLAIIDRLSLTDARVGDEMPRDGYYPGDEAAPPQDSGAQNGD